MKRKLFVLASLAICIAIIASGTLAYYTTEDTAHNILTSNGVDIEIEEWQKQGEELVPYPKDEPIEIMPGITVSKIAAIKNKAEESYIRAKLEVIIKDAEGNEMCISNETMVNIMTITMNEERWLRKEGDVDWWYYDDAVAGNEVTKPLFTEVVFDGPNMTNEYQNCTVEVIVTAQAVQSANNGEAVLTADGWPEE